MKKKPAAKKGAQSRRAKGQTQTSLSMSESILAKAREAAAEDKRSLSQWIELMLEEHFAAQETPALKEEEYPIQYRMPKNGSTLGK